MKYIVTNEMNGIMEILDSKGIIAHANSIHGYNDIDTLNSAIILLKREGYRVFESQDENRTLSGMDIDDFYEWMNSDNVIKNRDGSYSTQDSNFKNRIGSIDELKRYYKREFGGSYAKGGSVEDKMSFEDFEETLQEYEIEGGFGKTLEKGYKMYYLPKNNPYSNVKFNHRNKRKAYKQYLEMDKFAKGGKTDSNLLMVKNQAKELLHHSNELISVLKKNPHVEAWVVAKIERATTDLSDVTHYLDGMFAKGGMMDDFLLKGVGKSAVDKMVSYSKENPFSFFLVTEDDNSNIRYFYLVNGTFFSKTLQGIRYDISSKRNVVRLMPKSDAVYEMEKYGYRKVHFAEGGRINYSEYYKMGGKAQSCEKFDENGQRKIDLKSIKELTECVNKLPQTKDFYFVDGEYTPERKRLHKQIIYNIKKDLVCVQNDKPIAILMGGSPASGKSTFLKKYRPYLLEEEILKVDADDIRSKLPEYEGYNATQTHLETKDIVNLLLSDRNIGIPCKFDLIYDGTMNSTKSYLPLIDLLKSLGYKIFVVYMDKVPKEVVIKRALERYKKSGRFVPLEVIEDFFDKGKSALNEVKNKVDGYMVIDGSNTDYKVIEKGGMQLPKTRLYSKIGEHIKVTPDKVIKDYKLGGNLHD